MRNSVHGTPEQFEAALENRIAQLTNNSVNSSSIKSASSYEIDEQYQERYIHSLIGDIDSKISKLVDSIQFEYNDNDIIITVKIDGTVKEYTVPYSDLKFDWDYIDDDVSYIIDEIRYDLDTYDGRATQADGEYMDEVDALPHVWLEVIHNETVHKKLVDKFTRYKS